MASLLTNDGLQDIWSKISCYTNVHIVNRVVQAIFFLTLEHQQQFLVFWVFALAFLLLFIRLSAALYTSFLGENAFISSMKERKKKKKEIHQLQKKYQKKKNQK